MLFLVYCSKSPITPENTDPDLDALGIVTDSLGNYIDSLGNVVIIDDNGNIISLGIAVDSLGNYIDSLGNTVILDSHQLSKSYIGNTKLRARQSRKTFL